MNARPTPPWARGLTRIGPAVLLLLGLAVPSPATPAVELPPGFLAETLATNLNAATALAPASDGRLFLAEQTGRVRVWKDGRLLPAPALTLPVTDYWERGLIGLTLHPDFPRTPHLFVLYVTDRPFVHHVVARFTVGGDEADPASEVVLLAGDDQATLGGFQPAGHQGGPLRFGPDGRLYVSLGEQTAGEPAQRLDTLQGKILRLNPDGSIPADNPFFRETAGKYRAIYARGVRNAFGLAVQPAADGGRFFFTDVGGSAFEEVNELRAGANYGWPHAEGFSPHATFTNPLHAYPPMVGQSIVGGAFIPTAPTPGQDPPWPAKWRGLFLFADYWKHWLKALDPDAPTNVLTFARGLNGPVATEWTAEGSLLVLNRGTIWRDPKKFTPDSGSLIRIRYVGEAAQAAAGETRRPAADFIPALDLPADPARLPRRLPADDWSRRLPAARGRLWRLPDLEWNPPATVRAQLALPSAGRVRVTEDGALTFPPGTVFVREYTLPGKDGLHVAERRLTVLGAAGGYGAAFRLDAAGAGELVEDGELLDLGGDGSPGWWLPALDPALGAPVLNPSYTHPTTAPELNAAAADGRHLLRELHAHGRLELPSGRAPDTFPRAARWDDASAPAGERVRLYLHVHCAVCHQPGGASRGGFDARLTTPLDQAGLLHAAPVAGDLGLPGARLLVPGDPANSLVLRRVQDRGFFRMPPVQFHAESAPILPVLETWIRSLQPRETGTPSGPGLKTRASPNRPISPP